MSNPLTFTYSSCCFRAFSRLTGSPGSPCLSAAPGSEAATPQTTALVYLKSAMFRWTPCACALNNKTSRRGLFEVRCDPMAHVDCAAWLTSLSEDAWLSQKILSWQDYSQLQVARVKFVRAVVLNIYLNLFISRIYELDSRCCSNVWAIT